MKKLYLSKELLLGGAIIAAPLCSLVMTGVFQNDMPLFPLLIICLLTLFFRLLLFLKTGRKIKEVRLTACDIAVALFISYIFLRWLLQREDVAELSIFRWFLFAVVYILARTVNHKETLFSALILSASLQAVVALLQKVGCLSSLHPLFDVTGTFNNPGPLGGYLAVGLVVAVLLYASSFRHWSTRTVLKVASIGVMGTAFYWADSRAGLLAVAAGLLMAYGGKMKFFGWRGRAWCVCLSVAAVAFVCILLFAYRPLSANARLLIWRVSSDMVMDKPLLGHGVGAFEKKYMFYQADYFRNHPQSDFLNVADNVTYPYNELLHIAVETGMCGLVLFLLVAVSPFVFSDERTLKAVLAAWLIFAMFSYPVNVVPLMMNFALFTGLCRGKTVSVLGVNRIFCGLAVVPLMGLLAVCGHVMLFFCESSTLLIDVLGRKVRNVEQVDLLQKLPLSCETYCMRGDIYLERKSYGQAEESYKVAAEMIPTRIRPNYKLWNLYLLQQDTVNARKMALHILAQRVKVENTFSIKVRGRMKQFLDEID